MLCSPINNNLFIAEFSAEFCHRIIFIVKGLRFSTVLVLLLGGRLVDVASVQVQRVSALFRLWKTPQIMKYRSTMYHYCLFFRLMHNKWNTRVSGSGCSTLISSPQTDSRAESVLCMDQIGAIFFLKTKNCLCKPSEILEIQKIIGSKVKHVAHCECSIILSVHMQK